MGYGVAVLEVLRKVGFICDVYDWQGYYPFGMVMPGRVFTGRENYRHGFNGQEKDNEIDL